MHTFEDQLEDLNLHKVKNHQTKFENGIQKMPLLPSLDLLRHLNGYKNYNTETYNLVDRMLNE